jgi:hypothetical protein
MAYWNWINEVYNYDDACVKIDEQQEELSKLIKENARLREALEFYADLENWQLRTKNETGVKLGWCIRIRELDGEFIASANRFFGGRTARQALKGSEE